MLINKKKKSATKLQAQVGKKNKHTKHHQTINVPELSGRTWATFAALYAWL